MSPARGAEEEKKCTADDDVNVCCSFGGGVGGDVGILCSSFSTAQTTED